MSEELKSIDDGDSLFVDDLDFSDVEFVGSDAGIHWHTDSHHCRTCQAEQSFVDLVRDEDWDDLEGLPELSVYLEDELLRSLEE